MNITDHRSASPHTLYSSDSGIKDRVQSFFYDLDSAPSQLVAYITDIDKSKWASADPDPVQQVLAAIVKWAPPEFWPALVAIDIKPLVARIRNWLLAMIRAKRKEQTEAGLKFIDKLNVDKEIVDQVKLQPVLRVLRKSSVASFAKSLADKYDLSLDDDKPTAATAAVTAPSTPPLDSKKRCSADTESPCKPQVTIRSELAIPKRQTRQKQNNSEPAPNAAPAAPTLAPPRSSFSALLLLNKRAREEPSVEHIEPNQTKKQKRKTFKKVHWKDDAVLLKVREFDSDTCPTDLHQERVEPHVGVASIYLPYDPVEFEITNIAANYFPQMGRKRGGTKIAPSPPDEPGKPLMLGTSPSEPFEHYEYKAPQQIPKIRAAPAAIPSDVQKFLTSYARGS